MYTVANDHLSISILDPETDLERCGSRYCVGGYIYQVTDAQHGPLLSGPQYPAAYPDVFDGQGAPDMFFTPLGAEDAAVGDEVGVIGVGRVRRTSPIEPFSVRHNPEVIEFLTWTVAETDGSIAMQTEQRFGEWGYQLRRTVTLDGRTIHSHTAIESIGAAPLPVRWFPHPFYPPTANGQQCRFSIPVSLPENAGYFVNEEGFICKQPDFDWQKGCFLALEFEQPETEVTIEQRHPLLGTVHAVTDYAYDFLPIWGNANTFSFEPYLNSVLERGQAAAWRVVYHF